MPGCIGTATICTSIIPDFKALRRIYCKKLSREAKHRLQVIEYYYQRANKNASLTARYFGCSRSFIFKWLKRFNRWELSSLESKSRRPKHTRCVQYDTQTVSIIKKIREEYPSYSAKKVSVILRRDYDVELSAASVGRIIKKYHMFFSKVTEAHSRRVKGAKRGWQTRKAKQRLKYYMKPERPRHYIEFDMKHISNGSVHRQYALCAIDPFTKEAVIHISSSCKASQGAIAVKKALDKFGTDIVFICDNGSENFGETYELLEKVGVPQVFARPHTPKDKPHIENFIGKYQKECLNESENRSYTVQERQEEADKWLRDWHYYRPHQALNYLTPAEFCATMGITI